MRTLSDSQKYRKNNTDRDGHNNGRLTGFYDIYSEVFVSKAGSIPALADKEVYIG